MRTEQQIRLRLMAMQEVLADIVPDTHSMCVGIVAANREMKVLEWVLNDNKEERHD